MDRAEAFERLEYLEVLSRPTGKCTIVGEDLEALRMAITALREQEQREKSEPLTLEQLQRMDGEPVWIAAGNFWALVRVGRVIELIENSGEIVDAEGWIKHMGVIYRYKPGGAGHG